MRKNRILRYTILLIVLFSAIYLTTQNFNKIIAFTGYPETIISVADEKSPLLELLVNPDEFPNDYKWSYIMKSQLGNGAASIMLGYFKKTEVSIVNEVAILESENVWKNLADDKTYTNFGQDFPTMNISRLSQDQILGCSYLAENATRCVVYIRFSNNISYKLDINVKDIVGAEDFESMINSVLNNLPRKYRELSN